MLAVLLAVLALAGGAKTPHDAVQRFIENHSPADACGQLAPEYKASLAASFGPCLAGMRNQPKTKHVKVFNERIAGAKATVEATYETSRGSFHERYRLERRGKAWLITGSVQI